MNEKIKKLNKEYKRLLFSQQTENHFLNCDLLHKHVQTFSELDRVLNFAVTIYDNCRMKHVYVSECHKRLFGDGEIEVHSEDLPDVMKNAIIAVKYVFQGNVNVHNIKVIREYRAKIGNEYKRVSESMQVLETDGLGNIWLVLCTVEISPNQQPPFGVNSLIINTATGESFSFLSNDYRHDTILSKRELEILNLITKGKLSKEISEQMCISVHTVNTHRQNILKKLNVSNSHEAIRLAMTLNLINND